MAPRDPFDVPLQDDQRKMLALWLVREIQNALDARGYADHEVDYWHMLYEQARTRLGRNQPWPDAADLTSYLATEKADAIHSRILRTVFVEPVWNVEGWGEAADRAPYVEEFHQWKVEEERLQSVIDRLALISLIEPRGLLEVSEGTETRLARKTMHALIDTDPTTGGLIFGEDGQVKLKLDAQGQYIEAQPDQPSAETVVDVKDVGRKGPVYRIVPYRDSLILPGHARDKADIWGYGKRFWKRYSDMQRQAQDGLYDVDAVDKMTALEERQPDPALTRSLMSIAPTSDEVQAEKELWEVSVLLDLNALMDVYRLDNLPGKTYDGARWYVATVHLRTFQLLRFQHDDITRSRYVPVILFPRPDRVTEGFSLIGNKLITIIEEHTAVRNMRADRSAMAVQAPIKRQQGALWDPLEQPWGPKAVIDVRAMNEIEPMVVPDVTQPLMVWEQGIERTAERLVGVNDIASGQVAQEARTLGEIQMATEQSFVRMDLIVRRFQEAMEDLAQIRHEIWKRTLAEQPDGVAIPASMIASLEGRGASIDQQLPNKRITADLLQGTFRFKPHGSVETADPNRMRADWIQFLQALAPMMQAFPMLGPMLQTPQAARAMFRQMLRVFRVPNSQAFIGSPSQDVMASQQAMQQAQLQQLLGPMMGQPQPGMPPGMPPPGMMGPQGPPPPIIQAHSIPGHVVPPHPVHVPGQPLPPPGPPIAPWQGGSPMIPGMTVQ